MHLIAASSQILLKAVGAVWIVSIVAFALQLKAGDDRKWRPGNAHCSPLSRTLLTILRRLSAHLLQAIFSNCFVFVRCFNQICCCFQHLHRISVCCFGKSTPFHPHALHPCFDLLALLFHNLIERYGLWWCIHVMFWTRQRFFSIWVSHSRHTTSSLLRFLR
jgi:hypothetical protein